MLDKLKRNAYFCRCKTERNTMRRTSVVNRIKDVMAKDKPRISTILYGSEARGESRADSDIDLLLLVDADRLSVADEEKIIEPLYDIELETGILINATVMPKKKWRSRQTTTPFYLNVQREGIVL